MGHRDRHRGALGALGAESDGVAVGGGRLLDVAGGHEARGASTRGRQAAEQRLQARPELCVHPEVDERVVASVAHGQPVADEPHVADAAHVVDGWVLLRHDDEQVQWEPAEEERGHASDHHLDHLRTQVARVTLAPLGMHHLRRSIRKKEQQKTNTIRRQH